MTANIEFRWIDNQQRTGFHEKALMLASLRKEKRDAWAMEMTRVTTQILRCKFWNTNISCGFQLGLSQANSVIMASSPWKVVVSQLQHDSPKQKTMKKSADPCLT